MEGLPPKNHLPQSHLTPLTDYWLLDLREGEGVKQKAGGMGDGVWGYLPMGGQGHWDLHSQMGHT